MISAAARNWRIAVSPLDKPVDGVGAARAFEAELNRPTPGAAATAPRASRRRKERRGSDGRDKPGVDCSRMGGTAALSFTDMASDVSDGGFNVFMQETFGTSQVQETEER
jgi:hypothetical protein